MTSKYVLDFAEDWAPKAVDERVIEHTSGTISAIEPPKVITARQLVFELPPNDLVGEKYWPAADAIAYLTTLGVDVQAACDAIADIGAPVRLTPVERLR